MFIPLIQPVIVAITATMIVMPAIVIIMLSIAWFGIGRRDVFRPTLYAIVIVLMLMMGLPWLVSGTSWAYYYDGQSGTTSDFLLTTGFGIAVDVLMLLLAFNVLVKSYSRVYHGPVRLLRVRKHRA